MSTFRYYRIIASMWFWWVMSKIDIRSLYSYALIGLFVGFLLVVIVKGI